MSIEPFIMEVDCPEMGCLMEVVLLVILILAHSARLLCTTEIGVVYQSVYHIKYKGNG